MRFSQSKDDAKHTEHKHLLLSKDLDKQFSQHLFSSERLMYLRCMYFLVKIHRRQKDLKFFSFKISVQWQNTSHLWQSLCSIGGHHISWILRLYIVKAREYWKVSSVILCRAPTTISNEMRRTLPDAIEIWFHPMSLSVSRGCISSLTLNST